MDKFPEEIFEPQKLETPKSVTFFPNGNTAAFNSEGKQIPELQESWFLLFIEFLKKKGIDPVKVGEFRMPSKRLAVYLPKRNNWTIR